MKMSYTERMAEQHNLLEHRIENCANLAALVATQLGVTGGPSLADKKAGPEPTIAMGFFPQECYRLEDMHRALEGCIATLVALRDATGRDAAKEASGGPTPGLQASKAALGW
jgi:hypothetical protein